MKEILLNIESKETRFAQLHQGRLYNLIVERKKSRQVTGNIYRGRVTNILQNIQSAFVDIEEGENGFIHVSDILENKKKFEEMFDMDFELSEEVAEEVDEKTDIEQVLKIDQAVLVQVVKEAIGSKGARLTSRVSIPGRYLVLLPNTPLCGVSRRIDDRSTRDRLKRTIKSLKLPKGMGLICRTASRNASQDAILDEAQELMESWQTVMMGFQDTDGPALLFEESDLIKRTLLTAIDKKYDRVLVDDYPTYQRLKHLYTRYEEEHPLRIELYRDKVPMFERFNVEREIDKALQRKIWLPGGGYLYFDKTEAMYTIDVNSGRGTAKKGAGNVEEALVRINLDAAEEIARQLRLRNAGGLIIVDFIDMRSRKNQRRVLERLRDLMKEDIAKTTILSMSEFGLVEMTRQRSRESLGQTNFTHCPYCVGKGQIKTHETVSIELERMVKKAIEVKQQFGVEVVVHPTFLNYLRGDEMATLKGIAAELNGQIEFRADDTLHLNDVRVYSSTSGKEIEV